MATLRAFFLFTCCLFVAIGPLHVMQMIAWGNMLHDYSRERTITEAAEMTFSGDYPCGMCRKIAEAKAQKQEREEPAPHPSEERSSLRLDFHYAQNKLAPNLRWPRSLNVAPGALILHPPTARSFPVPTPPPKHAAS